MLQQTLLGHCPKTKSADPKVRIAGAQYTKLTVVNKRLFSLASAAVSQRPPIALQPNSKCPSQVPYTKDA